MKKITSAQSATFKDLVKIASKQSVRNKRGVAILEGVHLSGEWLDNFGSPEVCVIREGSGQSLEVSDLIKKCEQLGVEIISLGQNLYNKISSVDTSVGIIFIVKLPKQTEITPLKDTLILERIQDPGNLGTILRSAAASGVEQIICSEGTVAAWSPKVLRSAQGAHFRLDILEDQDIKQDILQLKLPVFATSLGSQMSIYDADMTKPTAWVFGNEGAGVSDEIQNMASQKLIIPQVGEIESLNVAMAATICLFEQARQRSK